MAETLQLLSVISFAIAGLSLVLTVFFWFFFKIPIVIGDLSGRTAKKSIEKMRAANERAGLKSYKESRTNAERGRLTGTIPGIHNKPVSPNGGEPETRLLNENKAEGVESQATVVLESGTTGLLVDENATAPLDSVYRPAPVRTGGKKIEIIEEIMLIHTDEVIR